MLAERLVRTALSRQGDGGADGFSVLNDALFYRNLAEVSRLRSSALAIERYVMTKKVR